MYKYEEIRSIHLELTERCQAACPHCIRFKDDQINPYLSLSELSIGDIEKILPIDFLRQLKKIELRGNFGEPIIAKDCLLVIEYFRKSNPTLDIIIWTNGGTRNSLWWETLAKILGNYGSVIFSIDGLEDTNHIYRKNVKWNSVINSVKSFIDAKGIAYWDFIIFDHNEHQLEKAKQLSKELGFINIKFKRSFRFASFEKENNNIRPAKDQSLVNDKLKISRKEREKLIQKNDSINCKALINNEIYISAKGLILPCCWLAGMLYYPFIPHKSDPIWELIIDEDFINSKKYSIKELLSNSVFDDIEKTWSSKSCLPTCKKKCGNNFTTEDYDLVEI